jgi:FixJ family two-component response regulator
MLTRRLIHVVDDDAGFLKGMKRLLNARGLEVRTFASAEEFQAKADLDEAACLILDVNMPGISGIELLNQLNQAGDEIPVVMVTASDSEVTRRAAMAGGCNGYLQKPFPSSALIEALANALGPDRELLR